MYNIDTLTRSFLEEINFRMNLFELWILRLKNKGIFKVSLKTHLLLIKRKYDIRLSIQNIKFTQLGLLLETTAKRLKTALQQLSEKHFATICFCRLENSTKFAYKISKIRQKSAKIILREDQSSQGQPYWKIWHKR